MLLGHPVAERTAKGVASEIGRLISSGTLPAGSRLPTIRALAQELQVSPTTIAQAWKSLAASGLIESKGKLGTVVRGVQRRPSHSRFAKVATSVREVELDLTTGNPDPSLLPDIRPALAAISAPRNAGLTTSYLDRPLLADLEHELIVRWPFKPEALTLVDGALDAIDRLFRLMVRIGDRVLVENPTFPPVLDLVERFGGEPVGLSMDEDGIVPSSLQRALAQDPIALVLQPRAQNPSGISMSRRRARELAQVLKGSPVLVIEDDHAGGISPAPQVSLGSSLPGQVIRVFSFSKAFGPDLRLAALGGPRSLIEELDNYRTLGPGWSSRLLQHVMHQLLTDDEALAALARARLVYAERRGALVDALARVGVEVTGDDGINLWVPVEDENAARVSLAARGIAVAPGSPFTTGPLGSDHVRITCSCIASGYEELAGRVALAAGRPGHGSSRPVNTR